MGAMDGLEMRNRANREQTSFHSQKACFSGACSWSIGFVDFCLATPAVMSPHDRTARAAGVLFWNVRFSRSPSQSSSRHKLPKLPSFPKPATFSTLCCHCFSCGKQTPTFSTPMEAEKHRTAMQRRSTKRHRVRGEQKQSQTLHVLYGIFIFKPLKPDLFLGWGGFSGPSKYPPAFPNMEPDLDGRQSHNSPHKLTDASSYIMSIVQNQSRMCSNRLFFRMVLSSSFATPLQAFLDEGCVFYMNQLARLTLRSDASLPISQRPLPVRGRPGSTLRESVEDDGHLPKSCSTHHPRHWTKHRDRPWRPRAEWPSGLPISRSPMAQCVAP